MMSSICKVILSLTVASWLALAQEVPKPKVPKIFRTPESVPNIQPEGLLGRWYEVYTTALLVNALGGANCSVADISQKQTLVADDSSLFDVNVYFSQRGTNGSVKQLFGVILNSTSSSLMTEEDAADDGQLKLLLSTDQSIVGLLNGDSTGDISNAPGQNGIGDSRLSDAASGLTGPSARGGEGNSSFIISLDFFIVAAGDLSAATPSTELQPASAAQQAQQYPWIVVTGPLGMNFIVLARDPPQFETQYKDQVVSLLQAKGFVLPPLKVFQSTSECNYPEVGTIIPSTSTGGEGGAGSGTGTGSVSPPNNIDPGIGDGSSNPQ